MIPFPVIHGRQQLEIDPFSNEVLLRWVDEADDPRNLLNNHAYIGVYEGIVTDVDEFENLTDAITQGTGYVQAMGGNLASFDATEYLGYGITIYTNGFNASEDSSSNRADPSVSAYDSDNIRIYLLYNFQLPDFDISFLAAQTICDATAGAGSIGDTAANVFALYLKVLKVGAGGPTSGAPPYASGLESCTTYNMMVSSHFLIRCSRETRAPVSPGTWTLTSGTWNVLQALDVDGDGFVQKYPLSPARMDDHPQYSDEPFWTAAYNAAVTAGTMSPGLVYGVDYPVSQAFGYVRT